MQLGNMKSFFLSSNTPFSLLSWGEWEGGGEMKWEEKGRRSGGECEGGS